MRERSRSARGSALNKRHSGQLWVDAQGNRRILKQRCRTREARTLGLLKRRIARRHGCNRSKHRMTSHNARGQICSHRCSANWRPAPEKAVLRARGRPTSWRATSGAGNFTGASFERRARRVWRCRVCLLRSRERHVCIFRHG